jgi:hypothetical protein
MPQDIQIKKNDAQLASQAPNAYIPDVAQDLRHIQGEQHDPTAVMHALNGISSFFQQKADKQLKEQQFADATQGATDAETNNVDNAKLAQSESYRNAVNKTAGERQGIEWYNQKSKELTDLQRQNPNMDFQSWLQQAKTDLYGANAQGDPHQLAALNQTAQQLEQHLSSQFTARQMQMEHAEAETQVGGKALALIQASNYQLKPSDVDSMIADAQKSGLTQQEARDTLGKVMAAQMSDGHPELYDALSNSKAQLHLDGQVGDALQKAYKSGQAVQKKQVEEANLLHGEELFKAAGSALSMARTGQFGVGQAIALQGKFPEHQLTSWIEMSERFNQSRAERASALAEKQALASADQQTIARALGTQDPSKALGLTLPSGDKITVDALKQGVNSAFASADRQMDDAIRSNDPVAIKQAQLAVGAAIQQGTNIGHVPESLSLSLNSASPTNPNQFMAAVKKMQVYQQAGLGDFVASTLHPNQAAALKIAQDQLQSGQDPQSVVQLLQTSPVKPHDAEAQVKGDHKALDAAVASISKTSDSGGWWKFGHTFDPSAGVGDYAIRSQIETRAAAYVARGQDRGVAITNATEDVKKQYDIIGGLPFAKGSMVPGFADKFGDYTKLIIPDKLKHYGDLTKSMTLGIMPDKTSPGSFYLISTNTGGMAPLKDEKGNYIHFNQTDMFEQVAKAKAAIGKAKEEWFKNLQPDPLLGQD